MNATRGRAPATILIPESILMCMVRSSFGG
jgi:hypothetical protein